jgi:hypothetical protein
MAFYFHIRRPDSRWDWSEQYSPSCGCIQLPARSLFVVRHPLNGAARGRLDVERQQ